MIHWFMMRGRMKMLLLVVPVIALAFVLFSAFGSTQPPELEKDSDGDGMSDAYEIFFGLNPTNPADGLLDYDGDALTNLAESVKLTDPFCEDTDRDGFFDNLDEKISRAYIQWGNPQFTTGDRYEYAAPDWFLGAYKNGGEWGIDLTITQSCWYVSACGSNDVSGYGSNGVSSLCVDLDRSILTNNLRYAVHYFAGSNASLYIDLLDTNGVAVAENLFGNLLSVSNMAEQGVIPAPCQSTGSTPAGIQSNNVVLLNIPTEKFPTAAVIQLRHGEGEIFICEGLLYIDEDGDFLDADQEKQIGASDYCVDSNGNGTNDYDECFNSGSWTNNPGDVPPPPPPPPEDDDKDKGIIIYVDQAIGNDTFTGRAPSVSANKKGPKKTVRSGVAIVETNDTIIIRSGNYNENLNIQGKGVKVFIEGKVKL